MLSAIITTTNAVTPPERQIHIVHEDVLESIQPFSQVSVATDVHQFCDSADNLMGDYMLLQWAEDMPWLQWKEEEMWPILCDLLPKLREAYYNDKQGDPRRYISPKLLADLRRTLSSRKP